MTHTQFSRHIDEFDDFPNRLWCAICDRAEIDSEKAKNDIARLLLSPFQNEKALRRKFKEISDSYGALNTYRQLLKGEGSFTLFLHLIDWKPTPFDEEIEAYCWIEKAVEKADTIIELADAVIEHESCTYGALYTMERLYLDARAIVGVNYLCMTYGKDASDLLFSIWFLLQIKAQGILLMLVEKGYQDEAIRALSDGTFHGGKPCGTDVFFAPLLRQHERQ